MTGCLTFWGTHGCDLPAGHDGDEHRCIDEDGELCSVLQKVDGKWVIRLAFEDGTLSEGYPLGRSEP